MTRKSKSEEIIIIDNWSDADNAVRQIGEDSMQIDVVNKEATDIWNDIKAEKDDQVTQLKDAIDTKVKALEAFCDVNRDAFDENRSRRVTFGKLGWRKGMSVSINQKNTIFLIKKVFGNLASVYLHIKESVNKEALEKLTDEQLKTVNARRKDKDVFFVEPDTIDTSDQVQ